MIIHYFQSLPNVSLLSIVNEYNISALLESTFDLKKNDTTNY